MMLQYNIKAIWISSVNDILNTVSKDENMERMVEKLCENLRHVFHLSSYILQNKTILIRCCL